MLGLWDLRPRDRGLQRYGERDAERETDVDERDRRDPPLPHEKERADAEQRGGQERASQVVHAKRGIAPARGGAPRESRRRDRIRAEACRPGRELRRAAPAVAADEIAREPQRDERRRKREEGVHGADCIALPPLGTISRVVRRLAALLATLVAASAVVLAPLEAAPMRDYAASAWTILPPGENGSVSRSTRTRATRQSSTTR